MNKILKILVIVIASFICLPIIAISFNIISHRIFARFEMSEEDALKIDEEARSKKDVKICSKIKGTRNINIRCSCISAVATKAKDKSLCRKIPSAETEWRNVCYKEVAKSKGDFSFCEKIGDESERGYCYFNIATETNNLELCKKINHSQFHYIDACIYKIAINTSNPELCDQIQNYREKMYCINEIKTKVKEN